MTARTTADSRRPPRVALGLALCASLWSACSGSGGETTSTPDSGNGSGGVTGSGGATVTTGTGGTTGLPGSGGNSGTGGTGTGGGDATGGAVGPTGGAGGGGLAAGGTTGTATGGTGNPGGGGSPGAPALSAATRALCTGTSPIVCHLGGNPGHYAVTVELGGTAAAQTQVQAEMHRLMLNTVATPAGTSRRYSFVVNVRTPEGQPTEDGPTEGIPGLDLYFYGSQGGPGEVPTTAPVVAPLLTGIGYAPAGTNRVGLWVAGDSTVCDQTNVPYAGWAQKLPALFDYPISVANLADSGESAVSFQRSGAMWGAINAGLAAGDWVLIQFGHNDTNDAAGAFQSSITTMVTQAKAKGAHPVLISPPARATFSGQTLSPQFVYGWGTVPTVMKQVATAQNVPFIDLSAITTTWYNGLGPNGWQQYHALGTDRTHTNHPGAEVIAGFVAAALKSQGIPLSSYLR